jgi:hypothetical protein
MQRHLSLKSCLSWILLACGAVVGPLACSLQAEADGAGSLELPPSTYSEPDARAVCAEIIPGFCSAFEQCNPTNFRSFYADHDDCAARQGAACVATLTLPGITVSEAALVECGEAASACAFFEDRGGSIYDSCGLLGALADATACVVGAQCQSGYCTDPEIGCGKCKTLGELGDVCDATKPCAFDLACGAGACVEPQPVGSACSDEAPCEHWGECAAGTCVARGGEGESCDEAYTCRGDRACFGGTCHSFVNVGPGEICSDDAMPAQLCERGACTYLGDPCQQYPAVGEPCNDEIGCGVAARCDSVTGTCQLVAPSYNAELCYAGSAE